LIFVGDDWAEAHHDLCVLDEQGKILAKRRVPEGLEGIRQFHALVADHAAEPAEVVVGIETDRGLFVEALIASGYQLFAINPFAASRYRERHTVSGAKSDPGDAKVLAELVRTDRQNHRLIAGDSELAEAVKILARGHQNLIWTRQRQMNSLRSILREFYPAALETFGDDLDAPQALAVLAKAPTPHQARGLSRARIVTALKQAGRQRGLDAKAKQICASLRTPHLQDRLWWPKPSGPTSWRLWPCFKSLTGRWLPSSRSCRALLRNTRTPRSFTVLPDSVKSSALGCWRSLGMTPLASSMLRPASATRELLRSPKLPELEGWYLLELPETADWPMPVTSGLSVR